ncbi:MAG: hypothetical protein ACTSR8_00555 [Promethearchaeota archaeon]
MPLRFRWGSKENLPIALAFFGLCGFFQVLFIFIAQYFLSIGNFLVVIIIPIGVTIALFYATIVIYESFAQVERSRKLKNQYKSKKLKRQAKGKKLKRLWDHPIARPLLINFGLFTVLFLISYFSFVLALTNIVSFILAENIATLACIFLANFLENNYARVRRV